MFIFHKVLFLYIFKNKFVEVSVTLKVWSLTKQTLRNKKKKNKDITLIVQSF